MTKQESTVLAVWLRPLVDYMEAHGFDGDALFRGAGVDIQKVFVPGARIPLADAAPLWQQASLLTGKPFIGLEVAPYAPPLQADTLAIAMMASRNLYEGIQRMGRLVHLVCDGVDVNIQRVDDELHVEYHLRKDAQQLMPMEAMDPSFLLFVSLTKGGVMSEGVVKYLNFARPQPHLELQQQLQKDLTVPLQFDAHYYGFVVDWPKALRHNPYWNPALAQMSEALAMKALEKLNEDNLQARVSQLVLDRIGEGAPAQDDIAADLNLSTRQLQRRLKALGTSYAQVLQHLRQDLSQRFILDDNMSMIDVAFSVGFRDQSNFVRWFKQWQGETPGRYRRRMSP